MSAYSNRLIWCGNRLYGNQQAPQIEGVSSALDWLSDPVDCWSHYAASLHVYCPAGAANGMLVVPSTTPGLGILLVAQAAGATSVSMQFSAPATLPAGSTCTVSSSAITVAPATGSTNAQIAQLINNSQSLVTAYLWGWVYPGIQPTSIQSDPTKAAGVDLVTSFSQTTLLGGAASSNQTGQIYLDASNDPTLASPADPNKGWILNIASTAVAGPAGSPGGNGDYGVSAPFPFSYRWVRARWNGSGSPTGQIYGSWAAKGNRP